MLITAIGEEHRFHHIPIEEWLPYPTKYCNVCVQKMSEALPTSDYFTGYNLQELFLQGRLVFRIIPTELGYEKEIKEVLSKQTGSVAAEYFPHQCKLLPAISFTFSGIDKETSYALKGKFF